MIKIRLPGQTWDGDNITAFAQNNPVRLGFLASHNGSSMQAIVESCVSGEISGRPALVVSNNSGAPALSFARTHQIPGMHISTKALGSEEAVDRKITDLFLAHEVDLVILSGYMRKVGPLLQATFPKRILNVHPSLLPAFGGKGMYGLRVHEAVIQSGVQETGVTIHFVDGEYDTGPVLAQRALPVLPGDTAESLQARLRPLEVELYVEVVERLCREFPTPSPTE